MTQLDLLSDVKALVEDAMASGQSFAEFREVLKPLLVKRGWWGQQMMDDSLTGETASAARQRSSSAYHLRYLICAPPAAPVAERIQRTKRAMPYLLYTLGPSREHRAEHLKWRIPACPLTICSGRHTSASTAGAVNVGFARSANTSTISYRKMAYPANVQQLDDSGQPTRPRYPPDRPGPHRSAARQTGEVGQQHRRIEIVPEGIDPARLQSGYAPTGRTEAPAGREAKRL